MRPVCFWFWRGRVKPIGLMDSFPAMEMRRERKKKGAAISSDSPQERRSAVTI